MKETKLAKKDRLEIKKKEEKYGCKVTPVEYTVTFHQDQWAFMNIEASSATEAKKLVRELLDTGGIVLDDVKFTRDAHISGVDLDSWEEEEKDE